MSPARGTPEPAHPTSSAARPAPSRRHGAGGVVRRPARLQRTRLEALAERAAKVDRQIRQRLFDEKITDRLVSLAEPGARRIRKGKLSALPDVDTIFIAGRQQPASRRTGRPLACYRVGCEGRISQLKRRYGLRRSRLRGEDGASTRVGWGVPGLPT